MHHEKIILLPGVPTHQTDQWCGPDSSWLYQNPPLCQQEKPRSQD